MSINVTYKTEELKSKALELSKKLGSDCLAASEATGLRLEYSEEGLALTDGALFMRGDFTDMIPRLKQSNLNGEMLVKTAKLKNVEYVPTLIDATAGMGEDSLLLAAAGFNVKMYEYNPIIAELLIDTIERAKENDILCDIVSRMEVRVGDSIEALNTMAEKPDVVLLDPMFPTRQKSGLIKKKFQLIQQLETPCGNEEELLNAALKAHPHKIVIKRPLKGPFLADKKPSYSLKGKAIRYDCIVLV